MDVGLLTRHEGKQLSEPQSLPERYLGLSNEDMDARIAKAREALGKRLLILGHHYQRDEVIKFADYVGDSFKLAHRAVSHHDAEFIIFCGVHFMAESADVLSAPHQQVILPDLAAGCSMADMASADQLETCWREMMEMGFDDVIPVTYINSTAAIKAFVGEHDGMVCTSSNAEAAFHWALKQGRRILFLPDQHLGRNTAYSIGFPLEEMVVWDPDEMWGGVDSLQLERARVVLWKGHCSVHTRFSVKQIENFRQAHPTGRVIVHPECTWDVVQAADDSGSTQVIIKRVTESEPGSIWAVGTESHLVGRLAQQLAPEISVETLDPFGCLCATMFRISPNHLLWALEGLVEGHVNNQVIVPDEQKAWVRVALDRMLAVH